MSRKRPQAAESEQPAPPTPRHWSGALLLAVIFAARLLHGAALKAPSYDEALYLVYGHSLWETGDFRLSIDKPPLVPWVAGALARPLGASFDAQDEDWRKADLWLTAASPWSGLQDHRWRFFLKDLHRNRLSARRLLFSGRATLILMNTAAVLGAFALAAPLFGAPTALWLVFFLTMCPNLLAHAGLVGEDGAVALFSLLSVMAFLHTLERPTLRRGALLGALTAAALLSKHSALTLGPSFLGLLAIGWISGVVARDRDSLRRLGAAFAVGAGAAGALFLIAYLGANLPFYYLSVKNTLTYQTRGQAAYLFGSVSNTGFPHYYLACLLLKLSPALLLLPPAWIIRRGWTRREVFLTAGVLIPAAFLVAIASANRIQIGLRYALPAVALLAVPAALAAVRRPWLGAGLGLWTALASISAHPDYLAYFNPLAGGEGWRRLSDANVDWGQDLTLLRDFVRKSGADEVILSYYGATLSEAVGFPFQDLWSFGVWGDKPHLGSLAPKKELLAVSATNRVALYLRRVAGAAPFDWLDNRIPAAVLGGSIFVYDITMDADAHARLARLYAGAGLEAPARREAARSFQIDPSGAALKPR